MFVLRELAIVIASVTKCQTSGTLASNIIFVAQRFRVFQQADQFYDPPLPACIPMYAI